MSDNISVESLFKDHSFEEIESVRDNLAGEIEKRTELLKSIVKEKYQDVVETSDAIQSMKLNLKKVEHSIRDLDRNIVDFYTKIHEPKLVSRVNKQTFSTQSNGTNANNSSDQSQAEELISQLVLQSSKIWDNFDEGHPGLSVKAHNEAMELLKTIRDKCEKHDDKSLEKVLNNLETNLQRSREMIKNHIWHRIQSAEPNQIGVVAGNDEDDLFRLSLQSSIEFLISKFHSDISDTSYRAQIRRYQPCNYFNTQTNQIDFEINDLKPPATGYVQIPKSMSIELSTFLYELCRVINVIAGFNLTKSSIQDSFKLTISRILQVYSDILPSIDEMKSESRRKRALQLYFDVNYLRVLLHSSKHIDLIEELDPRISELSAKFETMLDTIELYVISESLHNNVIKLSQSTKRLYGLLTPTLQ